MDRQIIDAIAVLSGNGLTDKTFTFDAEVISVDENARTCVCEVISAKEAVEVPDVRLMAAVDDGVLIVPAIGSTVTVVSSTYGDPYVTTYSEVTKIVLMGGEFGGLLKIVETLKSINTIEKDLNAIKQAFQSWIVLPGDGGAALKTAAASWFAQTITETKREDLENDKITQGA